MLSRTGAAVVAEAGGTFLFFFVGLGAGVAGADLVGVAFAHGLELAVLVSALGAVSGGHFNPAVTVAVRVSGGIGWGGSGWVGGGAGGVVGGALLGGAVAAGFAVKAVFPEAAFTAANGGTPALGDGI